MDRIDAWELVRHLPEVGRLGKRLRIYLLWLYRINNLLLKGGVVYRSTCIVYVWMWHGSHVAIINELKLLLLFILHLFLVMAICLILLSRFVVL